MMMIHPFIDPSICILNRCNEYTKKIVPEIQKKTPINSILWTSTLWTTKKNSELNSVVTITEKKIYSLSLTVCVCVYRDSLFSGSKAKKKRWIFFSIFRIRFAVLIFFLVQNSFFFVAVRSYCIWFFFHRYSFPPLPPPPSFFFFLIYNSRKKSVNLIPYSYFLSSYYASNVVYTKQVH